MDIPDVPQDDLLDVMEMTQNMENYIARLFRENEVSLAISAVMSGVINGLNDQCRTLDEVLFYRGLFMQIYDSSIRSIRIKD